MDFHAQSLPSLHTEQSLSQHSPSEQSFSLQTFSEPSLSGQAQFVRSLEQLLAQQKQQLAAQRSQDFGFEWDELSPSIAILHDPLRRNGWSYTGYLGFDTKRTATVKLRQLQRQLGVVGSQRTGSLDTASSPQLHLRKARRLATHRWEIKATDITPELLDSMLDE